MTLTARLRFVPRILSGIQPSGSVHLGNYLGALRNWVSEQHEADCYYSIVDLHAITAEHDPRTLRDTTKELATVLFAIGLDPEVSCLFVQSHVPEHAQLGWIMESTVTFGELSRMTQFKDKGKGEEKVRASLFTYPALMAADILLYRADKVPVGDDQRQHIELARNAAARFNNAYGEVFTIPEPMIPKVGARVMDLQNPSKKMSKSSSTDSGIIYLSEDSTSIAKKIKRAVTDTENKLVYEPNNPNKAGVTNLLEIYSAFTSIPPQEVADNFTNYGGLKTELAEVVVDHLTAIQLRIKEISEDPNELLRLLHIGAAKASEIASSTLSDAKNAIGFLAP